MTKNTLKIATMTTALVAIPFAAFAQLSLGDQVGTTEDEIRQALTAAGYEVVEIEVEDDEIEAEVMVNGTEVEIEIASDGTISEMELEDEDEDDDDDDEGNG